MAETTSAGGNLLPRSPLTADRQPSRPPPAGQSRATIAGETRGPSEGLHEGPTLGRGGRGKSATPQPTAGPRGRDRQAASPRPSGGGARGPDSPPHSPPLPLRPKSGRRRTEETTAPHPPRRGRCTWGEGAPRPRQAPPVNRPHAPALPAAGRRRTGGAQDGASGAAPSEAGLGNTGLQTRAGGVPSPSPPPHRTDPLAANRAAPDARGRPATPTAGVYPKGGTLETTDGRPTPNGAGEGGRWGGPPPPPPCSPPQLEGHRSGPPPLRSRGGAPPPPEGTATRGGGCGWTCTPRAPAPPAACSRGGRGRWASPHQRSDLPE